MIIEFDDHGLIMSQSLEAFASTYGVRPKRPTARRNPRSNCINHLFFVNKNNKICYECEPCQVLSMLAVTFQKVEQPNLKRSQSTAAVTLNLGHGHRKENGR